MESDVGERLKVTAQESFQGVALFAQESFCRTADRDQLANAEIPNDRKFSQALFLGGISIRRRENRRRGLFPEHRHSPFRLTGGAELHEDNIIFFHPDLFQHLEHVAVSRTGGIKRDSLAAQFFQASDAGIG